MSLISESEIHILYRFITHRVKYFKPLFLNILILHFDDYSLQTMKTQNLASQKIWILHKIIKKDILKRNVRLLKSMLIYMHSILGWASFCMNYCINYLKRGLWITEQQLSFSLAQVRCFWRCFCFRSGYVALFLKMSERGDSWLQLQFIPCEALPSVWISLAWQYSQACGHPSCLCTFSYSISSFQSTLHLIWFDTALFEHTFSNDPLWLILFVEGVNDRLLDHCQVRSVPHYCGFKEQEISGIYTVWMVIYWNSNVNILLFWYTYFWLSGAVSSNHQN